MARGLRGDLLLVEIDAAGPHVGAIRSADDPHVSVCSVLPLRVGLPDDLLLVLGTGGPQSGPVACGLVAAPILEGLAASLLDQPERHPGGFRLEHDREGTLGLAGVVVPV